MFISRRDGNVTTTVQVNTGQRFVFAMFMGIVGFLLIHYALSAHPWRWDLILIGALMMALGIVVITGAGRLIRKIRAR